MRVVLHHLVCLERPEQLNRGTFCLGPVHSTVELVRVKNRRHPFMDVGKQSVRQPVMIEDYPFDKSYGDAR